MHPVIEGRIREGTEPETICAPLAETSEGYLSVRKAGARSTFPVFDCLTAIAGTLKQ